MDFYQGWIRRAFSNIPRRQKQTKHGRAEQNSSAMRKERKRMLYLNG
jgi:hypothetical protein